MRAKRPLIREQQLERLRTEQFDLAVIGGGVNGAAVARDASMRGLRVALLDKGDFAGATSSRSSKLIHGGLRYLPQGQLRLVREALRERERLMRLTAPHLVRPMRFLFPLYQGRGPGRLALGAGLWLYDLLARTPGPERHRSLDPAAVSVLEPALERRQLRGGALYYDAFTDDARLTLENALDAGCHGAALANYVALEGFTATPTTTLPAGNGRLAAAAVREVMSGERFELRARVFVNAGGPWVDDIRRMEEPAAPSSVRLTKGAHLMIASARVPISEALVLSDGHGRICFAIPRGDCVLVGTTDSDFSGARERLAADQGEITYLLGLLNDYLPGAELSARDVEGSFAALRSLSLSGEANAPFAAPREETVVEGRSGLLSVAGGKLTTHRAIAQRVTERILERLGRPAGRCPTLDTPLPGARALADGDAEPARAGLAQLAPAMRARLVSIYGTRAALVAELTRARPELAAPLAEGSPVSAAEVIFAVGAEMAVSLGDCLLRRVGLWSSPRQARAAAPAAARLMAQELGWNAAHERAELAAFEAGLASGRGT